MAVCMFLAQSGLKTIYIAAPSLLSVSAVIDSSTCSIGGHHFIGCSEKYRKYKSQTLSINESSPPDM